MIRAGVPFPLRFTVLGSGTSNGVPMPACTCPTCRSTDPRDRRFRASLCVQCDTATVVVDTTPEFRLQALRAGLQSLDAVLITHTHADHVNGFDDLRSFTCHAAQPLPVYGRAEDMAWIRQRFGYIWNPPQKGGSLPKVDLRPVATPFAVGPLPVIPVPLLHGCLEVYGYRFGDLAYLTDVSSIPEASFDLLRNLRVLILDAVRYRPHATHFHLEAAMQTARRIGAQRTIFTHLSHDFLHERLENELPPDMIAAYDGLRVTLPHQGIEFAGDSDGSR